MADHPILDPRVTLARPDLAALALQGVVASHAYRAVVPMQAVEAAVPLRADPDPASALADQLLFGEVFDVLETDGDMAWGQARRSGLVGHVPVAALSREVVEPTHRVAALTAPVLDQPGQPPILHLDINALVRVDRISGGFGRIERLGWVALADLADLGHFDPEPAAVAERFLGAPYQSGGRRGEGLDAPALVQQALYACGRGCPRAADQQQALGEDAGETPPARGDLIFWPGHVAIMLDEERLIHASAGRGVSIETLAMASRRLHAPAARRRLSRF